MIPAMGIKRGIPGFDQISRSVGKSALHTCQELGMWAAWAGCHCWTAKDLGLMERGANGLHGTIDLNCGALPQAGCPASLTARGITLYQ